MLLICSCDYLLEFSIMNYWTVLLKVLHFALSVLFHGIMAF